MSCCRRTIVKWPSRAPQKCIEEVYKPLWHAVFDTNLQKSLLWKVSGLMGIGSVLTPYSHVVHAELEDLRPQFGTLLGDEPVT